MAKKKDLSKMTDQDLRDGIEVNRFKRQIGTHAELARFLGVAKGDVSKVLKNGRAILEDWYRKTEV